MHKLENVSKIRGVLIILVVFGHVFPSISLNNLMINFAWRWIYNFHMIPFFAISGMLYYDSFLRKDISIDNFLKKKFKLLIIPYISFSLLNYTIINFLYIFRPFQALMMKAGYGKNEIKDIFYSVLTYQNHVDKHLWFIYVLFLIFAVIVVADKLINNDKIKLVLFFSISFLGSFMGNPQIIKLTFLYSFYFYLGRYLLKNWNKLNNLNANFKLISIALFIAFNSFITVIEINFSYITHGVVFHIVNYINGALSIIAIIAIINTGIFAMNRINILLNIVGNYSYEIYLLHQPFLVSGISGVLLIKNINLLVVSSFITIIGIVIPIVLCRVFLHKSRILSTLFLGRKSKVQKLDIKSESNIFTNS